jgi:chromosome segregation ATPase
MTSPWKVEMLARLVDRNSREAEPFLSVYSECAQLFDENVTMATRMIEFERAITDILFELKSRESGSTLLYFTEKMRALQDILLIKRSEDEEARDTFSYFRGRVIDLERKLAVTTDELRASKEELDHVLDRYASYEQEIARHKSDISRVCDENAKLKAILKSRNITFS